MSKKPKQQKPVGDLTISAADLANPHIKRFLKEQAARAEREAINSKVPELLKAASALFERKFETASSLIHFLSPRKKAANATRGARITKEQKEQVLQLRKSGKSDAEIATALQLQEKQVKRVK